MVRIKILFFLLIAFTLIKCNRKKECHDNGHERIEFSNMSSANINFIREINPNDSIWKNNGSTFPNESYGLISAGGVYSIGAGLHDCWEYYYKFDNSEYYFFFHHDTVQKIGWEGISGTNRGLLKRVKVNLEYLQQNNFTISYP